MCGLLSREFMGRRRMTMGVGGTYAGSESAEFCKEKSMKLIPCMGLLTWWRSRAAPDLLVQWHCE